MSLYDDPPHRMAVYSTTTVADGAGRQIVQTLVQSDIPCSINRGGASTRSQFSQTAMIIPARVGVLSSLLTQIPQRGWTAVATHQESGEQQYLVFTGGVSYGEAYEGIPSLTYLGVEIQL